MKKKSKHAELTQQNKNLAQHVEDIVRIWHKIHIHHI
jgi:hypothetical protein